MIPWWGVAIVSFGFTAWSLLCVLIGAGMANNATKAKTVNPKMN